MSAAKDRLKRLLPEGAFGRSVAVLAGGWGEGVEGVEVVEVGELAEEIRRRAGGAC